MNRKTEERWAIVVCVLLLALSGWALYYAATEGVRQKWERDVNVAREAIRREGLNR